MSLVKYKNPTEYSFYLWIENYPESTHWCDRERFLKFARTVCAYNAKKWKDTNYLEKRILEKKPVFNRKRLQDILILHESLIDFHKTPHIPRGYSIEDVEVKAGYYLEKSIKKGKIFERQLPIKI